MFQSITHLHLFACVNTVLSLEDHKFSGTIKVLDVGCGNGIMLASFASRFASVRPELRFEFYGIDVYDSSVQHEGYFAETIHRLDQVDPDIVWSAQLKLISASESWPFESNFFDFIVSNQVLEHVFDHNLFFTELKRTLKFTGVSFHLFPTEHVVWEPHLFIPFVHRFSSWSSTYQWIKLFSLLGFGIYRSQKKAGIDKTLEGFARRHSDYMAFQVNYLNGRRIKHLSKKIRFKISYDFTAKFYWQKLRSIAGLKAKEQYSSAAVNNIFNALLTGAFKRVNNITLVVRKDDSY